MVRFCGKGFQREKNERVNNVEIKGYENAIYWV